MATRAPPREVEAPRSAQKINGTPAERRNVSIPSLTRNNESQSSLSKLSDSQTDMNRDMSQDSLGGVFVGGGEDVSGRRGSRGMRGLDRRRSSLAQLALFQATSSLTELSHAVNPNRTPPARKMSTASGLSDAGSPVLVSGSFSSPRTKGPSAPSPTTTTPGRPQTPENDKEGAGVKSEGSTRGYREIYEDVYLQIRHEMSLQSSMPLDRRTKMLEPVALRRRVELSLLQYRHLRMPPKTAEAAHRTLHLCIPDWVEVPDMWTVGHVLYEPLSVLLVDEEGQVVKPWSSSIEIKAYLVNAVGDVVYERFDYADPLAGHTANVNPRGTATFPDLRVLMPSDLTRGGAYKLCFVATDWAVEPVVSREFSVIDETRPHGANFKYPLRCDEAPIAYAVPASGKPRGSNRIAMTSPMHVAVAKGNPELCSLLLSRGDTMNVPGPDGLTPLHVAAFLDFYEMVRLGMESGADVNMPCSNGFTALHYAIVGGAEKTSLALLRNPETNHEAIGLSGWHALHLSSLSSLRAVAVHLLDSGCEVDVANFVDKQTPLHVASFYGRENLVFLLLDAGADPIARARRDWTPLHLAVLGGNASTVEALLSHPVVAGNVDARLEGSMYTPLHLACLRARDDIVRVLLARGADPKCEAGKGWTTAHLAAVSGSRDVLDAIAETGADLDVETEVDGETLLKPRDLASVFIDTVLEDLGPGSDIIPDVLDRITRLSHAQPQASEQIAQQSPVRRSRGKKMTPL